MREKKSVAMLKKGRGKIGFGEEEMQCAGHDQTEERVKMDE